jgi:hypothetical protein
VNRTALLLAALIGSVALASCGGDDSPPPPTVVAPAAATVQMDATTAGALKDEAFEFTSAPDLGTTGTTTVTFRSAEVNPTFTIAGDGGVATGDTAFGSCIFRIRQSTFPPSHPLGVGKIVTVDPCGIDIDLNNQTANGQPVPQQTLLRMARSISRGRPIPVSVSPTGVLQVKGVTVATVPTTVVTGGTGG